VSIDLVFLDSEGMGQESIGCGSCDNGSNRLGCSGGQRKRLAAETYCGEDDLAKDLE